MAKKQNSQDLEEHSTISRRSAIPELIQELGIGGETFGDDPAFKRRLEKIMESLPEPLIESLHERMTSELVSAQRVYQEYLQNAGISKSEERLLASLLQGMTVIQHAENSHISINTARTHMRRLLEKTGSNGQLDLVQKIHALKSR